MKQRIFEEHRESQWSSFSKELDGFKRGYRMQNSEQAVEFIEEYQRLTRDLSVAKARGYSRRLIASLNALVIRGHNVIYVYRAGFFRSALKFLVSGFPERVRRERGYVFVAAAMFTLPLLAMVFTILQAPEWVYSVMSASQVSGLEAMYDPSVDSFGRERQSDSDFQMFGFYILNNVSIAFQLFASGLLFGLGSVAYLVFNGVFIGAVTGHLLHVGYAQTFLSFVAGHGSFELTAIVLAGSGGLMLGHALIAPKELGRLTALRIRARGAVEILIGAGCMLLIAAFIEAFWSSSSFVASWVKYGVGVILWALVLGYFIFSGRQRVVV